MFGLGGFRVTRKFKQKLELLIIIYLDKITRLLRYATPIRLLWRCKISVHSQFRQVSHSMANTIELAQVWLAFIVLFLLICIQTGKRDHLKSLEKKYQAQWQEQHLFEVTAPSQDELRGLSPEQIKEKYPKWFGNFPYPYMNGSLHLGHAFTISKVEFAAGYQRMLGKRVLFPHGLHATGMPIKVRLYPIYVVQIILSSCSIRQRQTK